MKTILILLLMGSSAFAYDHHQLIRSIDQLNATVMQANLNEALGSSPCSQRCKCIDGELYSHGEKDIYIKADKKCVTITRKEVVEIKPVKDTQK